MKSLKDQKTTDNWWIGEGDIIGEHDGFWTVHWGTSADDVELITKSREGTHRFQRRCLAKEYGSWLEVDPDDPSIADDAVAFERDYIKRGLCPRCGFPFPPGVRPHGSRVTECRCIPICDECEQVEALGNEVFTTIFEPFTGEDLLVPMLMPVYCWQSINGFDLPFKERVAALCWFSARKRSQAQSAEQ